MSCGRTRCGRWTSRLFQMARGFVHLAAVLDWFSRRVLSWHLSTTLEVAFCLDAAEEALARHGRPAGDFQCRPSEIAKRFARGSQFTSAGFTGLLLGNGIAVSMDGRGAWRDNVFVERLWRSAEYEEVYLRACEPAAASARRAPRSPAFGVLQPKAPAFEP